MPDTSWNLTGNSGTNPPTDFVGTTDNQPLVVATNGVQRVSVDTAGNVEVHGNVGIGTASPRSSLEASVNASGKLGPVITLTNPGGSGAAAIDMNTFNPAVTGTYNPSSRILAVDAGNFANDIVFQTNAPGAANNGLVERVRVTANGVGIATNANPRSVLEASANAGGALGPVITLTNTGGNTNAAAAIDMNTFNPATTGTYNPSARIQAVDDGNYANDIVFFSNSPGAANNGLVQTLRISTTGISMPGTLTVTGDIILAGGDCAEKFDVSSVDVPEPGTVVVLDPEEGGVRECQTAYDKKVAGVVSGAGNLRPAIMLDGAESDQRRVPLALNGKIYCKVDARYAPIEPGDLLTTSETPGYAMKATDVALAFGAVVGKALQGLQSGQQLIQIIVSLQ